MNNQEARSIAIAELQVFREMPYPDLTKMIDADPVTMERTGPSATQYQIEIEAFWDGTKGGDVRVRAHIDDKGWRAFCPIAVDFIKSQDESFVGE